MERARSSPLPSDPLNKHIEALPAHGRDSHCQVCPEMLQGACITWTLPTSTFRPPEEAGYNSGCWVEKRNKRNGEMDAMGAGTGCGEHIQGGWEAVGIQAAYERDCLWAEAPSLQYMQRALNPKHRALLSLGPCVTTLVQPSWSPPCLWTNVFSVNLASGSSASLWCRACFSSIFTNRTMDI